jgi:hypothetical protein
VAERYRRIKGDDQVPHAIVVGVTKRLGSASTTAMTLVCPPWCEPVAWVGATDEAEKAHVRVVDAVGR